MAIWFGTPSIEDAKASQAGLLSPHLGIEFTEFGADFLRGTMPVEPRTRQPMGFLHGGASVVLVSEPELLLLLELLPQAAATRLRLTTSTKLHRSRGVMRVMVGESSRLETRTCVGMPIARAARYGRRLDAP